MNFLAEKMNKDVNEIGYFFYSQAFADGLLTTVAILLPALVCSYLNIFDIGLSLSLGALCVSISNVPGPYIHKRNSMLICSGFLFLISIITVYARLNDYTMLLEIFIATFIFSMFNIYGNRAASVGSAALLLMILMMDKPIDPSKAVSNALLIAAGSLFYMVFNLLLYKLRPYRIAQRALGENIREIAKYLSIKANFYEPSSDLDKEYKKLVAQQIIVHEKQDSVREILFKTRRIVNETTNEGRKLVLVFVETVDLFEAITASYYDYGLLRNEFADTRILTSISQLIKKMAEELDQIGIAIQANTTFKRTLDADAELITIKNEIDQIEKSGINTLVLKRVLVNLRRLFNGYNEIGNYFESKDIKTTRLDHTQFISHQSLDPVLFWNNFSLGSSVFRHSLRVCIACVVGYAGGKFISNGHHNYWILMTIVFMMKPAFSLTKQRNIYRITGTLIGGLAGIVILVFIPNKDVQFAFLVLFMLGTYSFIRINYLVAVIFTTPYILILFKFLGLSFLDVAKERVLDTAIGCFIAIAASYLLFPHWESSQLKNYMANMVRANKNYLEKIGEALSGKSIDLLQYKLARKEVYVSSANLSAAFQRMLSEPKNKQTKQNEIHQFVVLNHILFSNIATVVTSFINTPVKVYPEELLRIFQKASGYLDKGLKILGGADNEKTGIIHNDLVANDHKHPILKEQLEFICKIANDIYKTTEAINS